jgi:UDP-GlcNAc:undecaprenyl-phosphate GlcNAc-1-phosphate transferase
VAERFPSLDVPAVVPLASLLLLCLAVLHATGLRDDRVAMRPGIKLAIMATAAAGIAVFGDGTRLFTFADAYAGGPWLSVLLTVVWILAVTNALNFMDNMDGLAAGVGVIAGACFLAAAAINGQWLVSGCLALLVGSLLGFLVFNFPPATIFMGDSGALMLGGLLAAATVAVGGQSDDPFSGQAWFFFAPLVIPLLILGVPLLDTVLAIIRRVTSRSGVATADKEHLHHRPNELSGGQRQRIGIARALYKQASVLVFDEATSALDNETELAVMEGIENLADDLTILIVAHRVTTLKRCDKIFRMDKGEVIEEGVYEEMVG